jgi:uracil-DNA glycosylase
VPPKNLPTPAEVGMCNQFLAAELASLPRLQVVLALGLLAHAATVRAAGMVPSRVTFKHGQMLDLPNGWTLANSYHVSRYNTNTGVLTAAMFEAVVAEVKTRL